MQTIKCLSMKWGYESLNSEFFFSENGCLTKVKKLILSFIKLFFLLIIVDEQRWIHIFHKWKSHQKIKYNKYAKIEILKINIPV